MEGFPMRRVPDSRAEFMVERLSEWARVYQAQELTRLLRRHAWTPRERALIRSYSRRLVRGVLAVVRTCARRTRRKDAPEDPVERPFRHETGFSVLGARYPATGVCKPRTEHRA